MSELAAGDADEAAAETWAAAFEGTQSTLKASNAIISLNDRRMAELERRSGEMPGKDFKPIMEGS